MFKEKCCFYIKKNNILNNLISKFLINGIFKGKPNLRVNDILKCMHKY